LKTANQDVRRCQACQDCDLSSDEIDISLASLVQLVLYNDDEVLSSRTVWSKQVLERAQFACHRGLNLQAVILALRAEAQRRGIAPPA